MRNLSVLGYVLLFVMISCTSLKRDHLFQSKELVDLRMENNGTFRLLYYKIDGEAFCYDYGQGKYIINGKNEILLSYDKLNSENIDASIELKKNSSSNADTRIMIGTNIVGDFTSEYTTILHVDSLSYSFKDVGVDTLLRHKNIKYLWVETLLPGRFFGVDQKPVPSFKRLVTKKLAVDCCDYDLLSIKIPVTYDSFFYKEVGIRRIKDSGNSVTLLDSNRTVSKRIIMQ